MGLAGGVLLGGYIAQLIAWRTAFLTVGIAGIVIAPFFHWLVRDPVRAVTAAPPLRELAPLFRKPAFWLLGLAAGCSSLTGYGLALWTPSVLMRSYGFSLIHTGQFMGSLLLIGGTAGVFAGGWLADRLGRGDHGWYARLPAIAWAITVPTFAAGLLSPSPWLAWPLLLIPNALNILWLGPITTAVQHLVPVRLRASAGGCFLFLNNLLGLGVGPLLMGTLSDRLKAGYGIDSLRYACTFCLVFYAVAAVLVLFAIRPLKRDWVAEVSAP